MIATPLTPHRFQAQPRPTAGEAARVAVAGPPSINGHLPGLGVYGIGQPRRLLRRTRQR